MIYGCRLKSRFKKSSQAGASSPAVTDTLTLQFRPRSHPRPHSPLFPSPASTFLGWWEMERERSGLGTGASASTSPFKLGWGKLREGEGAESGDVEFGHTLWRDNRASCIQYSVQPLQLASALAPGGYCPGSELWGGISLHPQPLLGGDKAKFPGWQISNFTRLKLWGLEGAGCVDSKVTADLKQWDLWVEVIF